MRKEELINFIQWEINTAKRMHRDMPIQTIQARMEAKVEAFEQVKAQLI